MIVHAGLPDGWKRPTLCGRKGKRAGVTFGDDVTCKLCKRVEELVSYFDEPAGFHE